MTRARRPRVRSALGQASTQRAPGLGGHVPRGRQPAAALHARALGLDPAFTVLDRADAADLIDLVRNELGLVDERAALSEEGDLPRDLLARGQRAAAARRDASTTAFPWCAEQADELQALFGAYVERKQRAARPRLRRPAALLARTLMAATRRWRRAMRRALRPRARRRVPGHQRAAGRDPVAPAARRARRHRRRRRRAGDLLASAPRPCATSSTSRASSRRRRAWSRSSRTTARRSRSSTRPTR